MNAETGRAGDIHVDQVPNLKSQRVGGAGPTPYALNPRGLGFQTLDPKPYTLNPGRQTLNPNP
jgi:hypothetical protein